MSHCTIAGLEGDAILERTVCNLYFQKTKRLAHRHDRDFIVVYADKLCEDWYVYIIQ